MEKLHAQELENLERNRSKWLIINLIGFIIWDGLRIMDTYLLSKPSSPILTGFMLLGWLIWITAIIQIVRLLKKVNHSKEVVKILNDEWIELNRFKTWRATLVAVVMTQMVIMLLSFVTEISGMLGAELTIFVAVTSAIAGFLYFNKE